MSKTICKYCANFDPDPNVNFCQCVPYPRPVDNYCMCVDFDGCTSSDLVVCPSCVFALKSRYCVLGYTDRVQSECPHYRSCLIFPR